MCDLIYYQCTHTNHLDAFVPEIRGSAFFDAPEHFPKASMNTKHSVPEHCLKQCFMPDALPDETLGGSENIPRIAVLTPRTPRTWKPIIVASYEMHGYSSSILTPCLQGITNIQKDRRTHRYEQQDTQTCTKT